MDVQKDRKVTDYIICTTARSGSNLLCDVLRNTRVLGRPVEAFNPDFIRSGGFREHLRKDDPVSVAQFVDWIRDRHRTRNGIMGTKLLYEDFSTFRAFPAFRDLFFGARLIHLRRRSKLRQAISYLFAEQTGQWIATDTPRMPVERVAYDYVALRRHLDRLVHQDAIWTALLNALGVDYLEVFFEDFLADMEAAVGTIATFVGAAGTDLDIMATLAEQKNPHANAFVERLRADLRAREFEGAASATYKGVRFV